MMQVDENKTVPDTAITYERAQPDQESDSGKLVEPPARKDNQPDTLIETANPSAPNPKKAKM